MCSLVLASLLLVLFFSVESRVTAIVLDYKLEIRRQLKCTVEKHEDLSLMAHGLSTYKPSFMIYDDIFTMITIV